MHVNGFVRGKGKFIVTEYIATDEKTGPRFPLPLTTGRILSLIQCRRADAPHRQLALAQGKTTRNSPARRGTARRPRRRLGAARWLLGQGDASPIGWRRAWSTPRSITPRRRRTSSPAILPTGRPTTARNTRSPPCRSRRRTVRGAGRRIMKSSAARAAASRRSKLRSK
jgi:hypothetical protein